MQTSMPFGCGLYADVILPLALDQVFTYSVPADISGQISVGSRVVVQFGARRFYAAIVAELHARKPDGFDAKEISALLDDMPLVSEQHLGFWRWMASYYLCSLGEILKAALPSGLKLESETKVYLAAGCADNEDSSGIAAKLRQSRNGIKISDLSKALGKPNIIPALKKLEERGIVSIAESYREKQKPKMEQHICVSSLPDEIPACLSRSPKQKEAYSFICSYFRSAGRKSQLKQALSQLSGISGHIFDALADKGLISIESRLAASCSSEASGQSPKMLNEFQQQALLQLRQQFMHKETVLLHGVTSSGKTEIYIHLIQDCINQGKQVLYLLPEIALTTQIIRRLKLIFSGSIGVYHSKSADAEKASVWKNLAGQGASYKVILGVRSAIFLPFTSIGLIIVDEEHETSFKQHDPAPRYHARDSAAYLARMHGAKLLLGTATPSVETYSNAASGKYGLVELKYRYAGIELPEINVIDIKKAKKRKQMRSHFSSDLIAAIAGRLDKGEQTILFQNRRGYAPYVVCAQCGDVPKCTSCDVSLTLHKNTGTLSCHYCGYTVPNSGKCLSCGSTEAFTKGFGTEKVEDELASIFPEARIQRLDLDSTRAKDAYANIIAALENGDIDILIGTQMVTKGLDFEKVSLVGILDADTMLNQPDFRAFERSFQMITQVSGRAGRSKKRGLVLLQTHAPEHQVISYVLSQDYASFFASQMAERQMFQYPPYTRLIRITIKHRCRQTADMCAESFASALKKLLGANVLGPEYPLVPRIQDYYLKAVLVKIDKNQPLAKIKEYIRALIAAAAKSDAYKSAVFIADADPM
jgi:primosomal protein N' (replication factor Y) (superfamily II helicase)